VLSRTRFFCRGRLFFREGTVAVRAVLRPTNGPFSIPVTGGTRLFRGQRGTLRVVPAGHDNSRLTLRLR